MSNLTPLLSDEQIEAFFEIGFVIVPDVFTPSEIEDMRAGFDRLQKMAYALSEPGIHNGSDFAIEKNGIGTGHHTPHLLVRSGRTRTARLWQRQPPAQNGESVAGQQRNEPIDQPGPLQNTRRQRGISVASGQRTSRIWKTLVEGRQRTRQLCPTSHRH